MVKLLSKTAFFMFRKKLANTLIFIGDMLAVWKHKEYQY